MDKSPRAKTATALGFVEVRTPISVEHYKRLHQLAQLHDTTVGALIGELTRRALTPKPTGRPSCYSVELGERIWDGRWMHRSWKDIAAEEQINERTARSYFERYEAEQRPLTGGRAA
ncbi:MAG: hypothetical protein AAGC66_04560 [Leifsonia sp.]